VADIVEVLKVEQLQPVVKFRNALKSIVELFTTIGYFSFGPFLWIDDRLYFFVTCNPFRIRT
jgi:hypothetical protein